jgi:hypothetical protein
MSTTAKPLPKIPVPQPQTWKSEVISPAPKRTPRRG